MKKLKQSFGYALKGLRHVYREERNFRIHCLLGCLVIVAGLVMGFGALKWSLLAICIGAVLALELTNSAIEYTWDHLEPEHHPVAGVIKDVMAAAVLVGSLAAFIVGIAVFLFL